VSTQELTFDLVLETKQAVGDIKAMLAKSNAEAGKAGKGAGNNFGNSFKSAVTGILSAISFNALMGGLQQAVGAYRELQSANVALAGSIKFVNTVSARTNSVLASNTASYEQKASALGLDSDKLYENTKATRTNTGAIKLAESQIKQKERALKDETKALEQNIQAVEEKKNLEIQSLRNQRGFNALSVEEQGLEKEITQLELDRLQAIKAGDGMQVMQLDQILQAKRLDQDIAQKRLDLIDQETDKIEDLYKVQIAQLRSQMEASKNRFDIDIEPAKRKLEDLKDTAQSVGGGKVMSAQVKKFIDQATKNAQITPVLELDEAQVNKSIDSLRQRFQVKGRDIIPVSTFKQAYSDLVKSGVTNLTQVEDVVTQFIESATVGRSAGVTLEKAVGNLSYAFRTNNSQIGNLSGIQENWSDLIADGTKQLEQQYIATGDLDGARRVSIGILSEEERVKAKLLGLDKVTQDTTGAFTDLAQTGALDMEIYNQQLTIFQQTLGEKLLPVLSEFVPILATFLDKLINFVSENPELVQQLFVFGVALSGISTVVSTLMTAWGLLSPAISGIGIVFTALSGPIGWIVAGIAALVAGIIWAYQNVEWFRDLVNNAFNKIVEIVNWSAEDWLKALGQIIDWFIKLPEEALKWGVRTIEAVVDYFKNFDFDQMWNGMKVAAEGVWESIKKVFSIDSFKKLGNGFMDFIADILRGIGKGIPGSEVVINPMIAGLPRFAKGGDFIVPDGYPNDSYLMRVQSRERVIVQTPQQQTDNRQINSGNTTQYIYQDQYKSPDYSNLAYNF
jgi:hypothetical protein